MRMTQTDTKSAPMLPYASGIHPAIRAEVKDPTIVVRSGDDLVAFHGSTLPPRCVLCGADGFRKHIKLTFSWDASFTMTKVSTLQLRQQAYVHAYLCAIHRARWASARWLGGLGIALAACVIACGGVIAALSEWSTMPLWTPLAIAITISGFALMIFALFFFTLRSRTLTCRKIQEGYLYLEGASPRFLVHLQDAQVQGTRGSTAAGAGE